MFVFDQLLPGRDYYAKYISISHDAGRVLVEDNFTESRESTGHCYNHTILVRKDNDGRLIARSEMLHNQGIDIPYEEYNEWGIRVHGPGMETFQREAIQLHIIGGPIPFSYKAIDLPVGEIRSIVPWGLVNEGGQLSIHSHDELGIGRRIPIWKGHDGMLYISPHDYTRFADEYNYAPPSDSDEALFASALGEIYVRVKVGAEAG